MAASTERSGRWLYGPVPDLLLGCGGLYALLFTLLLLPLGAEVRRIQPAIVLPLVALLAGGPHYGATLLRVYEHRRDRRSYVLFSLWATLLVSALFVTGLWVSSVGVFLLTLYLTWSPWHYTGQNYGIAVMFLRRNGVDLSPVDKRWVYASFVLSFALAAVVMHSGDPAGVMPAGYDASAIRFRPLGFPHALVGVLAPALAIACGVSLLGAAVRLLRRAPPRALAPAGLLALTQVLWFSLPFFLRAQGVHLARAEVLDWDFRTFYFLWIAIGHHLQYLWVTSYYARQSSGWQGYRIWYAKVLGAGSAVWILPALLFSPLTFGPLAMDQGLALLVAAAVNVHHFILDGAIWKLRGRIAEVLIRAGQDAPAEGRVGQAGLSLRPLVWGVCAFGVFLFGFQVMQEELVRRGNVRGDLPAAGAAWDRLGWFGLDAAAGRLDLARRWMREGDLPAARSEFERSLLLADFPEAWDGLAQTYAKQGDWRRAAEICEEGLVGAPDHVKLLGHAALAWRRAGEPERALPFIERATRLAPDNPNLRAELERAREAAGRAGSPPAL